MLKKFANQFSTVLLVGAVALAAICVSPSLSPVRAEELNAVQIMEKVVTANNYQDMTSKMTMHCISSAGQERNRVLTTSRKKVAGLEKALIRFIAPADVKGTAFLTIENKGRDDDRMLYLPALHKTRRIGNSGRGGSFMGSDFSYDDLKSTPKIEDYNYKLLKSEVLDGVDTYVLEQVPKTKQTVIDLNNSKSTLWVRKDNFILIKELYLDRDGKEYKLQTRSNLQNINGLWVPLKVEMKNLQENSYTTLLMEDVKVNTGLADDLFTERNLQ